MPGTATSQPLAPRRRAPAAFAALALALGPAAARPHGERGAGAGIPGPARADDPAWQLYQASLGAADGALRLHETDQCQRWLELAPAELRGFEWHHLARQRDRSSARYAVHGQALTDLAASADGRWLATASGDGTAAILDAATGAVQHILRGHTASVWSPAFAPDGRRLATVSSDGTLRLWDVDSGAELSAWPGNGQGVSALAFGPGELLATCSWKMGETCVIGVVDVWDAASGELVRHLEHGVKPIASMAFSPDGALLAVGTWDFDVALFDVATWTLQGQLVPPAGPDYLAVRDLAFAPDGQTLAVCYADGRARLWDMAERVLARTLDPSMDGAAKEMNDIAYAPDGRLMATVAADQTLRLWDATSGKCLAILHGHERAILSVAFSPDGSRIFTGGSEGDVRRFDLAHCAGELDTWSGPSTSYSIAFDPRGERAATAGWGGWIRIVETKSGRELSRWQGHEHSGVGVDWSSDGRYLVTTGNEGSVVLWNAADGERVVELERIGGQILAAAFHPDATLVAAPGEGGSIRLWRVPSGELAATLDAGGQRPGYLRFDRDGSRLAAGHPDGSVRLWDVAARQLVATLTGHPAGQVTLCFDPAGERLLSASGRDVRLWSARDGALLEQRQSPVGGVHALDWSSDGARIAAGLANKNLEVWDAASGAVLLRRPYSEGVWFTRWSPDGRDLYAQPMDDSVRVLRGAPRPE